MHKDKPDRVFKEEFTFLQINDRCPKVFSKVMKHVWDKDNETLLWLFYYVWEVNVNWPLTCTVVPRGRAVKSCLLSLPTGFQIWVQARGRRCAPQARRTPCPAPSAASSLAVSVKKNHYFRLCERNRRSDYTDVTDCVWPKDTLNTFLGWY